MAKTAYKPRLFVSDERGKVPMLGRKPVAIEFNGRKVQAFVVGGLLRVRFIEKGITRTPADSALWSTPTESIESVKNE